MLDAMNNLLDSDLINEETKQEINEAWEAKLNEAREQARSELREEFAQKYEHDKQVMTEALDAMVTDTLSEEIKSLQAERDALAEDRVKQMNTMKEAAERFDSFLVNKLAEEIAEVRQDRKVQTEGFEKLEQFVIEALADEIREFQEDKKDLVMTKVNLVAEARDNLEKLKANFVTESAKKIKHTVTEHLTSEMSQLKEDIKVARENNFGRKIFEAYCEEFGATYLNEHAEIRKLQDVIAEKDTKLQKAFAFAQDAKRLAEQKDREMRSLTESNERQETMDQLLAPLQKDKAEVMRSLLESVQTSRLKNAFEKYLPAVIAKESTKSRKVIAESTAEVTGDKTTAQTQGDDTDPSNVVAIKRLAGL